MWAWLSIFAGLITFFIGFFFAGASNGQNLCVTAGGTVKDKKEIEQLAAQNFGGGVAGIVICLTLVVVGIILRFSERRNLE